MFNNVIRCSLVDCTYRRRWEIPVSSSIFVFLLRNQLISARLLKKIQSLKASNGVGGFCFNYIIVSHISEHIENFLTPSTNHCAQFSRDRLRYKMLQHPIYIPFLLIFLSLSAQRQCSRSFASFSFTFSLFRSAGENLLRQQKNETNERDESFTWGKSV